MKKKDPLSRQGRPRKPRTELERTLLAHDSQYRDQRRRISGQDRKFIQLLADNGYKDPNSIAIVAGFKEPFIGERLVERLRDLIDAERLRRGIGQHMELDEALRILGEGARDASEGRKVQAVWVRMVLEYHGVLKDKPMDVKDRRAMVRQVAELVDQVNRKLKTSPEARRKVRTMLAVGVEATDESGAVESASATQQLLPPSPSSSPSTDDQPDEQQQDRPTTAPSDGSP